jgi:MoaA/NifB/PqqE/SkfB family radical SAM enzyme
MFSGFREKLALAAQSPRYVGNRVRNRVWGPDGASFPSDITLFLTDRCNFACKMCHYGEARAGRLTELRTDMPLTLVDKASSEASRYGAFVELFGGEPLLHPEIAEAVRIASRKNVVVTLTTNGLLLPRMARALVENRVHIVRISLDGWDEPSQQARGNVADSFQAILDGIRELSSLKNGSAFPSVRMVTVITKVNCDKLHRIQSEIYAAGVRHWTILNYEFITKAAVDAHRQSGFGDRFIGDPVESGGYLGAGEVAGLRRSLVEVQRNARSAMRDMQVRYPWHVDLERYYSDSPPSQRSVCTMPLTRVDIHRDGRIALCGDGHTIGNLHDTAIRNAWTGERMRQFRAVWHKTAAFPMCFRCCGIENTIGFDQ